MECRKASNLANCACKSQDCARRGTCCECVAYHRSKGNLPACLRPPQPKPEAKA
jgi:hypothetical protein